MPYSKLLNTYITCFFFSQDISAHGGISYEPNARAAPMYQPRGRGCSLPTSPPGRQPQVTEASTAGTERRNTVSTASPRERETDDDTTHRKRWAFRALSRFKKSKVFAVLKVFGTCISND